MTLKKIIIVFCHFFHKPLCTNVLFALQSDFELMCNNCMTYNQQDTIYYKAAKKLLHIGLKIMAPEKVLSLKRELPSMTTLSKEQVTEALVDLGVVWAHFLMTGEGEFGDHDSSSSKDSDAHNTITIIIDWMLLFVNRVFSL